ncbi:hypothetical protein EVAR_14577_1 [Eumeta japonica]|uniref:Uncharacterized protein n=1 Tax=Eumeta variegata TaxID=151549 RepID=A0A4C1UV02_EUMVA|nr:hypothetical protein EVAR_14577_1 [Eumeta japonica]
MHTEESLPLINKITTTGSAVRTRSSGKQQKECSDVVIQQLRILMAFVRGGGFNIPRPVLRPRRPSRTPPRRRRRGNVSGSPCLRTVRV